MKIGCIFTAFNTADYLPMSLTPWVAARAAKLGDHEFVICAVSVPFTGFQHETVDDTQALLRGKVGGEIDHLIESQEPMAETEARGAALKWLVSQGVDVTWQVDADEEYTSQDISRIAVFVNANPFIAAFRICLKNLVFTPDQYLAEPFGPMRVHRVRVGHMLASSFWADNNVFYETAMAASCPPRRARDDELATMTIPKAVAWIRHSTWLNDDRSRRKIEYQTIGRGWPSCSFRWDPEKGLAFNEDHYRKLSQPLPRVLREGS